MFDQNAPISSPDAANDAGTNAPSARPAYAREILGDALPKQQTGGGAATTNQTTAQQIVTIPTIPESIIAPVVDTGAIQIERKPSPFRAAIQAVFFNAESFQGDILAARRKHHPKAGRDTQEIILTNARAAFAATTPKKAA
ncbi:hypothetical protein KBB08_01380 [Candidatus Gracilibacteria bacterium]|nr:hypothetical protein [Candidatus Gracilibacteria bacterium]